MFTLIHLADWCCVATRRNEMRDSVSPRALLLHQWGMRFAFFQVWVKPSSEMSYLYGNNVLKSGLGRITENTPAYQGVVVMSMSDIPLGFGTTSRSTQECRKLDPSAIVAFHQADTGPAPTALTPLTNDASMPLIVVSSITI